MAKRKKPGDPPLKDTGRLMPSLHVTVGSRTEYAGLIEYGTTRARAAMTEQEWLSSDDPAVMLAYLSTSEHEDRWHSCVSDRKLRLFACALARGIWSALHHYNRQFIDWQEDNPDKFPEQGGHVESMAGWAAPLGPGFPGLENCLNSSQRRTGPGLRPAEQASLLRDVFGNPFQPKLICKGASGIWSGKRKGIAFDTDWLTWNGGTVPKLAQAIYDDRAFDRLPILADALEEAGCQDADILGHCRGPGPHVRGCWVVDLILGKE